MVFAYQYDDRGLPDSTRKSDAEFEAKNSIVVIATNLNNCIPVSKE